MSCPTTLAKGKHTATVIFLHGLGDTGHGWLQHFSDMVKPHVKVICPNAPSAPVTLNAGMRMPSWFDIKGLDFSSEEDGDGLKKSSNVVKELIKEEIKNGISSERIIIGGFSQGGSVALHTLQTSDQKLGGCIGLSTFMVLHQQFKTLCTPTNKKTNLFLGHGDADPLVHYRFGAKTRDLLKSYYDNVVFESYSGMGHSSCVKEMHDVKKFIDQVIPEQ